MRIELQTYELEGFINSFKQSHQMIGQLTEKVMSAEAKAAPPAVGLSLKDVSEVCRLAPANKIQAIRLIREVTKCSLKEAKDVVEGNYSEP